MFVLCNKKYFTAIANSGTLIFVILRILAISGIFIAASIAWIILGSTISSRTQRMGDRLSPRIESVWGTRQAQWAPAGGVEVENRLLEEIEEDGKKKKVVKTVLRELPLCPAQSRIRVALDLEHRQKGMLWYSTYTVAFDGNYGFQNPDPEGRVIILRFPLPAEQALYDGLQISADGRPLPLAMKGGGLEYRWEAGPSQKMQFGVRYKSQGLGGWRYGFGEKVTEVHDFDLQMTTNFAQIDFADSSLAPVRKTRTPKGWQLDWQYQNLLSGFPIALEMPEKLQPGPLAAEIAYFAPVSLFFYFFLLFLVTTLRGMDLHPMNYFFLAGAFFAFHLLLAYLMDQIDLHLSFLVASAVSIGLTTSYLRLVTGASFAFREAAVGQFIYLILFSYAFFFQGLTGLTITIGAIATLFVAMQATGRIRWSEKFGKPLPPPLAV